LESHGVDEIRWTAAMRELMRLLSKRGAAKGGHARAAAMTKAERKARRRRHGGRSRDECRALRRVFTASGGE
jgi:hypothetical protein